MYPRIPWKLVTDPLGSTEYLLEPLVYAVCHLHSGGVVPVLLVCAYAMRC